MAFYLQRARPFVSHHYQRIPSLVHMTLTKLQHIHTATFALLQSPPLFRGLAAMEAVRPVNDTSADPKPATKRRKLQGREFYESIGSPRTVVAPMVDQSELVRRPAVPVPRRPTN